MARRQIKRWAKKKRRNEQRGKADEKPGKKTVSSLQKLPTELHLMIFWELVGERLQENHCACLGLTCKQFYAIYWDERIFGKSALDETTLLKGKFFTLHKALKDWIGPGLEYDSVKKKFMPKEWITARHRASETFLREARRLMGTYDSTNFELSAHFRSSRQSELGAGRELRQASDCFINPDGSLNYKNWIAVTGESPRALQNIVRGGRGIPAL